MTSAHDGAVIGVHDMPLLGHAYSVEFYPQAFTLSPFGEILLSPLTRIGEIQKQASEQIQTLNQQDNDIGIDSSAKTMRQEADE